LPPLSVAVRSVISDNSLFMLNRILRILLLVVWLEFGLLLILLPWSDYWQSNYFLIHFPDLGSIMRSPYLRGAVSGLGVLNVFFALESFRHRVTTFGKRS
jgi:hypothetical protein